MTRMKRITSTVIAVCFIFNTACADYAMALAPADRISGLEGIEAKDIIDIKLWTAGCLKVLGKAGFDVTVENFRKFNNLPGNTIFQPKDARFYIDEATPLEDGCVRLMVRKMDGLRGPRTYYIELSKTGIRHVYPKGKSKERTKKDLEAMERYEKAGEAAIDSWIEERIKAGDFAEIKGRAHEMGWDEKYPDRVKPDKRREWSPRMVDAMRGMLDPFLKRYGMSVDEAFKDKNIVFIRVPKEAGYPKIAGEKTRMADEDALEDDGAIKIKEVTDMVIVTSHSSNNAVYFFLPEYVFDRVQLNMNFERFLSRNLLDVSTVHEIGAIHGMPYRINVRHGLYNDLVMAYISNERWNELHGIDKWYSSSMRTPVDLDTNLDTRDYAAGRLSATRHDDVTNQSDMEIKQMRLKGQGVDILLADSLILYMSDWDGKFTVDEAIEKLREKGLVYTRHDRKYIGTGEGGYPINQVTLNTIKQVLSERRLLKSSQTETAAKAVSAAKPALNGKKLAEYAKLPLSEILPKRLADKLYAPDDTYEAMAPLGIATIGDLMRWTKERLLGVNYFYAGKIYPFRNRDLKIIEEALQKLDLTLPRKGDLLLEPLSAIGVDRRMVSKMANLSNEGYSMSEAGIGDINVIADLTRLTEEEFQKKTGYRPEAAADIRKLLNVAGFDFAKPAKAKVTNKAGHNTVKGEAKPRHSAPANNDGAASSIGKRDIRKVLKALEPLFVGIREDGANARREMRILTGHAHNSKYVGTEVEARIIIAIMLAGVNVAYHRERLELLLPNFRNDTELTADIKAALRKAVALDPRSQPAQIVSPVPAAVVSGANGRGGIATASSGALVGFHLGPGGVNAQIRETIRANLGWIIRTTPSATIEQLREFLDGCERVQKEGGDLSDGEKLPVGYLFSGRMAANDGRQLIVVELPVNRLATVSTDTGAVNVTAHLGLIEGIIWVAGKRPDNEKMADKLHELSEYNIIQEKLGFNFLNLKSLREAAAKRDEADVETQRMFKVAHSEAWKNVIKICSECITSTGYVEWQDIREVALRAAAIHLPESFAMVDDAKGRGIAVTSSAPAGRQAADTAISGRGLMVSESPEEVDKIAIAVAEERAEAIGINAIAGQIGEMVWQTGQKYNYIIPSEFTSNSDLKKYGSRFNFETYGGTTISADKFIKNITDKIRDKDPDLTIALVPRTKDLTSEHLAKLTAAGIRYALIDSSDLLELKGQPAEVRGRFQEMTYASMQLIRFANKDTLQDSRVYAGLSYCLKSHFDFDGTIESETYVRAIINGDAAWLIKGYVSYRVFQHYDAMVEHRTISGPLIFA